MNLQRIAKQFAAAVTAQGIILLQQLVLPPVFIHRYGIFTYGEWLTLTAAVSYLSTLQFGMQTFVNNELTMRYSRHDMGTFQVMQSTALRMLLGIAAVAGMAATIFYALPMQRWLRLSESHVAVSTTLFFLGLQVIANVPLNYFAGTFMVFGRAHRGTMWQNTLRFMIVIVTASMAWFRASFPHIAEAQFCVVVVYTALILVDLKRLAPDVFPTLRYWDGKTARQILKPSGYFGLMLWTTFLAYQLPVLMLQRLIGPVAVVGFTVARTLFSMVRQGLQTFTFSLGPEITHLFGKRDWKGLSSLYAASEKVLFSAIPTFTFGMLVLAPFLLHVWLHKPGLYDFRMYVFMAVTSCAIAIKEHKVQFQFSTNQHHAMARFIFGSYLVMAVVAYAAIAKFGVNGFIVTWFAAETGQMLYTLHLNYKWLGEHGAVEIKSLLRMGSLVPFAALGGSWLAHVVLLKSYPVQVATSLAYMAVLLGICAWVFKLKSVIERLIARRARDAFAG
jgi:O-antigen/teichoic acid export membrane protein